MQPCYMNHLRVELCGRKVASRGAVKISPFSKGGKYFLAGVIFPGYVSIYHKPFIPTDSTDTFGNNAAVSFGSIQFDILIFN